MLYEITYRDITTQDYSIPQTFTENSSLKEDDIGETLDRTSSASIRQELPKNFFFYQNLQGLFKIDLSSVYPSFELINETYVTEELTEEDIITQMLEHDFIVRMSPVKEYTVQVRIKGVEEATPRIVEPEGF